MSTTLVPPRDRKASIPSLENGDRLTRDEFERRYAAMPTQVKAELIEGVVYTASPVKIDEHAIPDGLLIGWLYDYCSETPGVQFAVNGTVRLSEKDEPQPDSCMYILPEYGRRARKTEDGFLEHAPELAIEVAASSVSKDLGPKKRAYAANGVRENLVWRTQDNAIDWFVLRNCSYETLSADNSGVIRSEVFPGLWLNVPAMLAFDIREVKATSREGVLSPEHTAFVSALQTRVIS